MELTQIQQMAEGKEQWLLREGQTATDWSSLTSCHLSLHSVASCQVLRSCCIKEKVLSQVLSVSVLFKFSYKRPLSTIYLCIFNVVQCVFGVRRLMSATVRMWLS